MFSVLSVVSLVVPLRAIELSLEENKGEKGTIGFVDMERLFHEYPETRKAKEQFEQEVDARRQEIKRRKGEIVDLKSELADLALERERLLKQALSESARLPAPATSTAPAVPPAPSGPSPGPALLQSLPGLAPAASTPTAASTAPVTVLTTATATTPLESARSAPAFAQASTAPVVSAAPEPPALSAAQRARAMEERMAELVKGIDEKEKGFKEFQAKAEAELLELEKHRVQRLLGNIYDVVQQVAQEEGISVVVDKKAILFGQKAVDLTDKLLERLR